MNIALLREFLGEDGFAGEDEAGFTYFDGLIYWQFLYAPVEDCLLIAADTQITMSSHPIVETGIMHCGRIERGYLTGPEPRYTCLTFYREGRESGPDRQSICMFTKKPDGRLSFAPNVAPWDED